MRVGDTLRSFLAGRVNDRVKYYKLHCLHNVVRNMK